MCGIIGTFHGVIRKELNGSLNLWSENMENLKEMLGSAREASLEGTYFTLVAHRTNDGQDDEDSWSWKLQEWVTDDEGDQLLSSRII